MDFSEKSNGFTGSYPTGLVKYNRLILVYEGNVKRVHNSYYRSSINLENLSLLDIFNSF